MANAEREPKPTIPDNMMNDAGDYICPRHEAVLLKSTWPSILRIGIPVYYCPSMDDGPRCSLSFSPLIGVIRPVADERGEIDPDELYDIVRAVARAI